MLASFLQQQFQHGLPYEEYLRGGGELSRNWTANASNTRLSAEQAQLISTFTRRMPVICISGIWCGDCAVQGPMLAAIAAASPLVNLVFLDRDLHRELADEVKIAGGNRVPTVIWMSEEFEFVHLLGDRTLSRYRAMASRTLGPSCELPNAHQRDEDTQRVIGEWVNEFERVQWILRLSPRLRQLHGD